MKTRLLFLFLCAAIVEGAVCQQSTVHLDGLTKPVEIITDVWGIPHIYALNEHDLFFAQGFYAAKDRLFQFEIWRRQATGTVAEILGDRELKRDIGTRLFQFRGDMDREMNYYHPRGKEIITAYVDGVNAYIEYVSGRPDELPIEFKLLGIEPQKWTPSVVVSRHQGLLGNIGQELNTARAVALIGAGQVADLAWFHPQKPNLQIDPKIDADHLHNDVLELYNAFRRPIDFRPEDIIASGRNDLDQYRSLAQSSQKELHDWERDRAADIGSNNWVVDGQWTESGYPMMANDPHRRHSAPSLRYMAHLVAPGWDVIGGGEPEIPGISIGHNRHGAWGLTVYSTDAEDLYVYELDPDDPDRYRYRDAWERMRIVYDTIPVKGGSDVPVQLKYTRHGPVVYLDAGGHIAYAVRCGWLEVGGAPYLASLRMDQAQNYEEFREACRYSHIPGENMVWADRKGNIGWQSVGIAPIRRNWSGLVPVPGDGSHEWEGYLPIIAKPNLTNPANGIINTSNENVTPLTYEHWDATGFSWSDPYRGDRVLEVLQSGRQHSLTDMAQLQTDYLSIPARQLVPLLRPLVFTDPRAKEAQSYLADWDYKLLPESIAAGIYNAFERLLKKEMEALVVPEAARPYLRLQMKRIIEWLVLPDAKFGVEPVKGRNAFLQETFLAAIDDLESVLGTDMTSWMYGQEAYKHVTIRHPLGNVVNPEIRRRLNVGPYPRGGNSYTVNNTSSADNQLSGGSFRMIVDTGNWDHCLATNAPGQHGDPSHPHYRNLFEIWASDQFFPMLYSKEKIWASAYHTMYLVPK